MELKHDIIDVSHRLGWGHIPSALSMVNYLSVIKPMVMKCDVWIIGKPYGSQAYYTAFGEQKLSNYERVIKTGDTIAGRTVDFADNTFGDCLSVAAGYALTNKRCKIWVNVSDTAFDVGKVLEACQFIAKHRLNNIFLTIDCNNHSVNSETDRHDYICKFLRTLGWNVEERNGDLKNLNNYLVSLNQPRAIIFKTIKGDGFPFMIKNPREWHYKTIDDELYLNLINAGDSSE